MWDGRGVLWAVHTDDIPRGGRGGGKGRIRCWTIDVLLLGGWKFMRGVAGSEIAVNEHMRNFSRPQLIQILKRNK